MKLVCKSLRPPGYWNIPGFLTYPPSVAFDLLTSFQSRLTSERNPVVCSRNLRNPFSISS